ncbi:MAG: amidotransferase 1, exosortase A system-associated, partial [Gammaproteobacteria bacterium]|nr:amidotransferase 1, exosortase A system-associated [Gammaproteobacteria bacterium]
MCGITGMYHRATGAAAEAATLRTMNATQIHRGPDEQGVHCDGPVGLGHTRLSIIDRAGGQQPMASVDREVWIAFNGEIYNFAEIRAELIGAGHSFRTNSDTEVILEAWRAWGEACVMRLRGMFAFAIWDASRKQLFLARDRLGIKPLYYAELPDHSVIFGSELKSLMRFPGLPRDLDHCAVEEYFTFGYVPDPRTIFATVRKLPPGCTLTVPAGRGPVQLNQYWDVPLGQGELITDPKVAARELRERLTDAVDIRLMSEVPLGAFLSGGVDSSAVVALMAGIMADPVKTCSIGFSEKAYNETEYARQVAGRYETDHVEYISDANDYELIDTLADAYDEPFADSSAIPTYRVCELAKRRVTVVLSGDGGDEVFAGYRRHRWHMKEETIRRVLPHGLRKLVFGPLGEVYPKLDWAPKVLRAKTTLQALAKHALEAYLDTVSIASERDRSQLFAGDFRAGLGGYRAVEVFRGLHRDAPDTDALSLIQYLDMKTYLPGDILTKVDRASMAHALEVRVPMLDHRFIEWAMQVAPGLKLQGGEGKAILKTAMSGHLSDDILYR